MKLNFKALPDNARVEENIKIFTQEEKDADYVENSKYNRKQADSVRAAYYRLNNGD